MNLGKSNSFNSEDEDDEDNQKDLASSGDSSVGSNSNTTPSNNNNLSLSSSTSTSWHSSKLNSGSGAVVNSLESNSSGSNNHHTSAIIKMISSITKVASGSSSSAPKSSNGGTGGSNRMLNYLHLNIKCGSPPSSVSGAGTPVDHCTSLDSQHYNTIHGGGTDSYQNSLNCHSPINYERLFQPSNVGSNSSSSSGSSKQRSRSHSGGPLFPNGFTPQIRHSALISAGMAVRTGSLRRQSDTPTPIDYNSSGEILLSSSSRSHRTSPNGSSLFESFR